jgi:hypothetical protein
MEEGYVLRSGLEEENEIDSMNHLFMNRNKKTINDRSKRFTIYWIDIELGSDWGTLDKGRQYNNSSFFSLLSLSLLSLLVSLSLSSLHLSCLYLSSLATLFSVISVGLSLFSHVPPRPADPASHLVRVEDIGALSTIDSWVLQKVAEANSLTGTPSGQIPRPHSTASQSDEAYCTMIWPVPVSSS